MYSLYQYRAAYLESLKGRALTPSFIRTETVVVRVFAVYWGSRDLRSLKRSDLYDYVLWLKKKPSQQGVFLKPRTVSRYALSAKRFADWLYRSGFLLSNPADGFELLPGDRTSHRPIPSQNEMAAILDGVDAQRERALFELMYSSGLRISEALGLELTDIKLVERVLLVRQGKGKKDRYVPCSLLARTHLVAYLHGDRRRQLRGLTGDNRKYLFVGFKGKMSWKMADARWKVALDEVHLEGKGYSLHSLRHACATHLLENGASVRYVQELLGHECLTTTQRYTRPGTDRIKAVYRTFHPRENELYEEITEDYRQKAFALRDELLTHREVHREKLPRAVRPGEGIGVY